MPATFPNPEVQLAFSIYESKGVYAILLGSGLSRSASIPTGWEITLDLIRHVALAQGVDPQPDWEIWYRRTVGKEPNYSLLLEDLSSSQDERRSIIHSYIEPNALDREEHRKLPTPAHHAIADLIAKGFVRVVITTNFDRLLENALRDKGVEPTVISSVDALSGAEPITHSACYILKLHGDYKDARILNTDRELEEYPPQYNVLLDRIFDEYGLIVCGWSGDWDHALRASLLRAPNRRFPTYWAARGKLNQRAQDIVAHRRARVIAIDNADKFFTNLHEHVETLSQSHRQNPQSTELLVNATKRYLGKAEYRISLHDLFEQELARLLQQTASNEFATNTPWSVDNFRNRRDKYEAIVEPVARMAGTAGRWGDGSELEIALAILRVLDRDARKSSGGLNHYINMRLYPSVLVFVAYGLGLTRAERLSDLRGLFLSKIDSEYREPQNAIKVLFPHSWEGGSKDLWNLLEKGQKLKTPLSDHLYGLFADWGSSFASLTPDFELLFEKFEILGGLVYLEATSKEELRQSLAKPEDFSWMPLGRSLWHEKNAEKLLAEVLKEPMHGQLLAAGFAHRDSETLQLYVENYKRMRDRVRWM